METVRFVSFIRVIAGIVHNVGVVEQSDNFILSEWVVRQTHIVQHNSSLDDDDGKSHALDAQAVECDAESRLEETDRAFNEESRVHVRIVVVELLLCVRHSKRRDEPRQALVSAVT
ncbi:unnamed protein product [Sphagnum balticum]